jgi:hypothetical protein
MKFSVRLRLLLALLCLLPGLLAGQRPDFSGTWKLAGEATLRIEHHDPELVVETLKKGKRALQRYTTDGRETTSTGIDGDECHTLLLWRRGGQLFFDIQEHERGKIVKSTETWSLIDGGLKLKRERVTVKAPKGRTLIYTR